MHSSIQKKNASMSHSFKNQMKKFDALQNIYTRLLHDLNTLQLNKLGCDLMQKYPPSFPCTVQRAMCIVYFFHKYRKYHIFRSTERNAIGCFRENNMQFLLRKNWKLKCSMHIQWQSTNDDTQCWTTTATWSVCVWVCVKHLCMYCTHKTAVQTWQTHAFAMGF